MSGDPVGFIGLTTLDIDPNCGADIEWDLERHPYPFADNDFDEVHAYHILEHLGRQGDWRGFLADFAELWRILKPNGRLIGLSPHGAWEWGDPGHTRLVSRESLTFLSQREYDEQVGKTPMTDYRHFYRADFDPIVVQDAEDQLAFILAAVKPSRISI